MMPLTILYAEYIDRPKLTEQKKTSWAYSSSLPTKVGVGTINIVHRTTEMKQKQNDSK